MVARAKEPMQHSIASTQCTTTKSAHHTTRTYPDRSMNRLPAAVNADHQPAGKARKDVNSTLSVKFYR